MHQFDSQHVRRSHLLQLYSSSQSEELRAKQREGMKILAQRKRIRDEKMIARLKEVERERREQEEQDAKDEGSSVIMRISKEREKRR